MFPDAAIWIPPHTIQFFKSLTGSFLSRLRGGDNGTELNNILPKMSPLNPQYLTKKQSVFGKVSAFVETFKGVGGQI